MSRRKTSIFKKICLKAAMPVAIFLALLCFGIANTAEAANGVPSIISYQGRLSDSSGNLVGGSSGTTYYFKFSIWDVSTGGSASPNRVWPASGPTSYAVTVRQGVFTADIGDTTNGFPDTLDYNFAANKDVYLQIEVSSDNSTFETLSPRMRISSAPFAQVAGLVSGTGQSSFGTTTPASNAIVTVVATTTSAIGELIRGSNGQTANLLRLEDSSSNHLFSVDALGGIWGSSTLAIGSSTATAFIVDTAGNVGIGTSTPGRKLNVFDVNSVPQLRLSQSPGTYGEFYVDSSGDVKISSTGGNIRQNDENLWVCSGGSCGVTTPVDKGNVIVETSVIFNNKFRFKQTGASSTTMYDTTDTAILEFDEGQ